MVHFFQADELSFVPWCWMGSNGHTEAQEDILWGLEHLNHVAIHTSIGTPVANNSPRWALQKVGLVEKHVGVSDFACKHEQNQFWLFFQNCDHRRSFSESCWESSEKMRGTDTVIYLRKRFNVCLETQAPMDNANINWIVQTPAMPSDFQSVSRRLRYFLA